MKLYKVPGAPAGERWHSSKTGLKEFVEIELPKEGRAAMALFFNNNETEAVGGAGYDHAMDSVKPRLDELEEAELRAVAEADTVVRDGLIHYDYKSPFSARTVLASIDASMCVKAITQFHGENLRKVVGAGIERVSQLLGAAPGGSDDGR